MVERQASESTAPTRFWVLVLLLVLSGCPNTHSGDDVEVDAGPMDFSSCAVPTDCVVVPASCCGSCGAATRGDAVAVVRTLTSEHRRSVCGDDADCPACFMEPDPTLVATCEAGACVVVDLQRNPATECGDSSECRVRAVECCECGATIEPWTVVAVSDAAALEALVCDPGTGCPECAPAYPDDFGSLCDSGRCVAVFAGRP